MPSQYGRPSEDTLIGNYEDQGSGTTDIFEAIDEVSYNDSDYIQSPLDPAAEVYVTKLSGGLSDPNSSSGHIVRVRIGKDSADGDQIDCTVQLREGYVDEGTMGDLIREEVYTDISDTPTTETITLTGGEADDIGDYNDLFIRYVFDTP